MGWSLSEEGGSKYQVQKSAGDGTRFKVRVRRSLTPQSDLNLCQLCPEPYRDLDDYKLLMLVHFILYFILYFQSLSVFLNKYLMSLLTLGTLARPWWGRAAEPDRGALDLSDWFNFLYPADWTTHIISNLIACLCMWSKLWMIMMESNPRDCSEISFVKC